MFDQRISSLSASPLGPDSSGELIRTLFSTLGDFALAEPNNAAPHQRISAVTPDSLATRYAAANAIARRRCDAILRDAEIAARTGIALIVSRNEKQDRSTIAAARFLGKSIATSLCKVDNLLAPQAA